MRAARYATNSEQTHMRDIDELIDQALTEEERALLGRNEPEPGFLRQVLAMGRGRLGWVMG